MKLTAPIYRLKSRARKLARENRIRLHQALDAVAIAEGFRSWSHLANAWQPNRPSRSLLEALAPGDLLLLAARPGEGKTVLGLEIAAEASKLGRAAWFFSSECTEAEVQRTLSLSGYGDLKGSRDLVIDLAESVCARHLMSTLSGAVPGSVAVIDYLQVMDQNRAEPVLGHQVEQLKRFANEREVSLVFLSQIRRTFDPAQNRLPGIDDVRMPNPLDLGQFTKSCFLHGGEILLQPMPASA
ncbi:DNA helicase [Roseibium sp.]|uniref:DNA helicase n=1 Tax=Roseibium sp. TaxID=1936156 RepID=UPI003BB20176